MEQPARYCEYCGKPLDARARFCGRCGKPVNLGEGAQVGPPAQPAPQPNQARPPVQGAPAPKPAQPPPVAAAGRPAQAAAPAEVVCGVIPGAFQKKGMLGFSQQAITLVLTNYRVIFAMQTNQMLQEQVRQARAGAKQEGKGFFGQWGAQLSAGSTYYQHKSPGSILAEQPGNFFIPHNQLRSVKFRVIHGGDESSDDYRLDFEAVTGKVSVMFTMIDQKKAKQALTQVLGEKVHWSLGIFG